MASPDLSNAYNGRIDLGSLANNASINRALNDMPTAVDDAGVRPQPPIDLTAAAFFDVDNTLVQGSSAVHFGRGQIGRAHV